jgi:hypothetical protein
MKSFANDPSDLDSAYSKTVLSERVRWSCKEEFRRLSVTFLLAHVPARNPDIVLVSLKSGDTDLFSIRVSEYHGQLGISVAQPARDDIVLLENFELNSLYTLEIIVTEAQVTISLIDTENDGVELILASESCFFETGVSVFKELGNENNYGEVWIHSLALHETFDKTLDDQVNNSITIGESSGTVLPSSILDLTNWYLTLPYGAPDLIKQPALNTFSSSGVFYGRSSPLAVVFRATIGGVTTSNSPYPRCELREMNGANLAKWNCNSGTHTMFVRQRVIAIQPVKPRVVVAQVHSSSDDFFLVRAGKDNQYDSKFVLDIQRYGKRVGFLDTDFKLNTDYTLQLKLVNGQVTVTYVGNGKTSELKFSSSSQYCFFRTGSYAQSNTEKGDKAGSYSEVWVSALTIKHQ